MKAFPFLFRFRGILLAKPFSCLLRIFLSFFRDCVRALFLFARSLLRQAPCEALRPTDVTWAASRRSRLWARSLRPCVLVSALCEQASSDFSLRGKILAGSCSLPRGPRRKVFVAKRFLHCSGVLGEKFLGSLRPSVASSHKFVTPHLKIPCSSYEAPWFLKQNAARTARKRLGDKPAIKRKFSGVLLERCFKKDKEISMAGAGSERQSDAPRAERQKQRPKGLCVPSGDSAGGSAHHSEKLQSFL